MHKGMSTVDGSGARPVGWSVFVGLFLAFAALVWPSASHAQQPLRDPCLAPATPLNVSASGGTASFSAAAFIKDEETGATANCAQQTAPTSWNVLQMCTFHCQHWHTFVPGGVPGPSDVAITPTPDAGYYVLGWSPGCWPVTEQPRTSCTVRVDGAKSVVATLGTAPDTSPPTAPSLSVARTQARAVTLQWTPASDNVWVGGYEVYKNGALMARVAPGTTRYLANNGVFCQSTYTFRVDAFDSSNQAASQNVQVRTGSCTAAKRVNTILHVGPRKRTKSRRAYFHWVGSPRRKGLRYQCKLDRARRWSACRPGKTYRNLRKGAHTFRVRAGDTQGWDRTPVVFRWRIV